MIDVVGAPESGELAEQIGALVGELGRSHPVDRVGTGSLADLQHLVADLVDRLVPADAGPFAGNELHRILQAPVAMGVFAGGGALGAMRTQVEGAVPAGLLADPDAVLHFGNDGAADR